jgi:hypothetical protein
VVCHQNRLTGGLDPAKYLQRLSLELRFRDFGFHNYSYSQVTIVIIIALTSIFSTGLEDDHRIEGSGSLIIVNLGSRGLTPTTAMVRPTLARGSDPYTSGSDPCPT